MQKKDLIDTQICQDEEEQNLSNNKIIELLFELFQEKPSKEIDEKIKNYSSLIRDYENDIDIINKKSDRQTNLLHEACQVEKPNIEIIKILLEKKVNVNALSVDNATPLHLICKKPNLNALPIIELLLENKADLNLQSPGEESGIPNDAFYCALEYYSVNSSLNVLEFFLKKRQASSFEECPLEYIIIWSPLFQKFSKDDDLLKVQAHQLEVVKLLLKYLKGQKIGKVLCDLKTRTTDIKLVEQLLKAKADPNEKNFYQDMVLRQFICDSKPMEDYSTNPEFSYRPDIVKLLLEYKADPNLEYKADLEHEDYDEIINSPWVEFPTLLQLLSQRPSDTIDYELVHLLLKAGAKDTLNQICEDIPETCTEIALAQKNIRLVFLFICYGANINDIDLDHSSQKDLLDPIDLSMRNFIKILQSYDANSYKSILKKVKQEFIKQNFILDHVPYLAEIQKKKIISFLLSMKHHSLWKETPCKPPKVIQWKIMQHYLTEEEKLSFQEKEECMSILTNYLIKLTPEKIAENLDKIVNKLESFNKCALNKRKNEAIEESHEDNNKRNKRHFG